MCFVGLVCSNTTNKTVRSAVQAGNLTTSSQLSVATVAVLIARAAKIDIPIQTSLIALISVTNVDQEDSVSRIDQQDDCLHCALGYSLFSPSFRVKRPNFIGLFTHI